MMTIICAIYDADAGKFWLGCDSGNLIDNTVMPEHQTKWLRFANWAVALAGLGVAKDVLETERPKFPNQTTDIGQVTSFIRAAFTKYDLGEVKGGARDYGICGLIAHTDGALYSVDARLAVNHIPAGSLWACGSGMRFALGADSALKLKGFTPEDRIGTAVFSAIDLDSACTGEPMIEIFG